VKRNARKLTALILVLAMLLSFVAVAEDDLTELGMDQPIEIEGEVVDEGETGDDGDTQEQEGEFEIEMDEAEGLPDGEVDPEGGELDLSLDLDGEALETGEEELAPVTEEAMNAADDGTSPEKPFDIQDYDM